MSKLTMKKLVNNINDKIHAAGEQWYDAQISDSEFTHLVDIAYEEFKTLHERNFDHENNKKEIGN